MTVALTNKSKPWGRGRISFTELPHYNNLNVYFSIKTLYGKQINRKAWPIHKTNDRPREDIYHIYNKG